MQIVSGENVTVNVGVLNTLSTPRNFTMSSTDHFAYVLVWTGYYTATNLSLTMTTNPRLTLSKPTLCFCGLDFSANYTLGPHQWSNQTFSWKGTWSASSGQYFFNSFQTGTYTIEAYDPLVSIFVLGYFVVANDPNG
jgi:hypothetical protein